MSKAISQTLIGIFVVGAVALAVIGVIIFGSGKFLSERSPLVMYFEGSVNGLQVGAPVVFRGVRIGSVKDIVMRFDPTDLSIQIPVFIEIEADKITWIRGIPDPKEYVNQMVERGLRARLQIQNLITGQLMVELDFHPDKPTNLRGLYTDYLEIPTIPSSLQEFARRMEQIPIDDMITQLTLAINGVANAVNSPNLSESMSTLNLTMKDIRKFVQNADRQITGFIISADETLKSYKHLAGSIQGDLKTFTSSTKKTVHQANETLKNLDRGVVSIQKDIHMAAKSLHTAFIQVEKTFDSVGGIMGERSGLVYELKNALKELSAAARSIRAWADYLERHPEALIRGKSGASRR